MLASPDLLALEPANLSKPWSSSVSISVSVSANRSQPVLMSQKPICELQVSPRTDGKSLLLLTSAFPNLLGWWIEPPSSSLFRSLPKKFWGLPFLPTTSTLGMTDTSERSIKKLERKKLKIPLLTFFVFLFYYFSGYFQVLENRAQRAAKKALNCTITEEIRSVVPPK